MILRNRIGLACLLVVVIGGELRGQSTFRPEGLQTSRPVVCAIRNATIHVDGRNQIDGGTILIIRDKIAAIGLQVEIPKGAMEIDASGRHIYPGLIDSYVGYSGTLPAIGPADANWNSKITPQLDLSSHFGLENLNGSDRRVAGFTNVLVGPTAGILRGKSFLAHLERAQSNRTVLKEAVAMQARLTVNPSFGEGGPGTSTYPGSPMGAYALARQTMYDAIWYRDAWQIAKVRPDLPRPELNASLASLQPVLNGELPLMVETSNELFCLRAKRFSDEFGLRLILLGSGNEYRRLAEIVATRSPMVIPLDFPKPPKLGTPAEILDASLESLMHWDLAPSNPVQLVQAGATIAFTTNGMKKADEWRAATRRAIERGLDPAVALEAWTKTPAQLFGVDQQIGTLEVGKLANMLLADGPLFDEKSKVVETWVLGDRFEHKPEPARKLAGIWRLSFDDGRDPWFLVVRDDPKLTLALRKSVTPNPDFEEVELKNASRFQTALGGQFAGEKFELSGQTVFELIVDEDEQAIGSLLTADGVRHSMIGDRVGDAEPAAKRGKGKSKPDAGALAGDRGESPDPGPGIPNAGQANPESNEQIGTAAAVSDSNPAYPTNYPLGAFGREKQLESNHTILITNATVWTCGPQGKLDKASVFIERGQISRVIPEGEALPEAETVFDAGGLHLTPGIIDCHSHMASDSGINEGTQAVTAEVRIGDFVDCDDLNIMRQLAGGVTCVNVLHGSANPIGGQNQVLKLRWGQVDEAMKFAEAPAGIKFALGENVKRSNSQTPSTRYPRTRMGVEQIMHDSFRAAREYTAAHELWKKDHQGLPPRVDLELEALAEIVRGERLVHCHSYRQDEILALIRVLDEHGIRIGTFQHILEGYKVADAMLAHGAMASAFSDWWAYKAEVYDAIPYAGAIMHQQGLVVSFNSDDAELARHLNHEAAKAIRYGAVEEVEALKFVTLNPARQLRIDRWVGSIEPGKQADFVLWSGHPLDTTSRCEQTWVDGIKYFDRVEQAALAERQTDMKNKLVQKALASGQGANEPGENKIDPAELWPRYDEFCHGHDHEDDEDGAAHDHQH